MKIDVINGFEHFIYDESEISAAQAKQAEGETFVHVETTCDGCGHSIHASVDAFNPDGSHARRIEHSDSLHNAFDW